MSYQIFFGAPRAEDIDQDPKTYYWQTVSSSPVAPSSSLELALLPPTTLEAASRRISLIYQNIIFREEDEADQPEDDPGEYDITSMKKLLVQSQTSSESNHNDNMASNPSQRR